MDFDAEFARLASNPSVKGVLLMSLHKRLVIQSTLAQNQTEQYASFIVHNVLSFQKELEEIDAQVNYSTNY